MSGFKDYVESLETEELKVLAEKYSTYVIKFTVTNDTILNRYNILHNEMLSRGFVRNSKTGKYYNHRKYVTRHEKSPTQKVCPPKTNNMINTEDKKKIQEKDIMVRAGCVWTLMVNGYPEKDFESLCKSYSITGKQAKKWKQFWVGKAKKSKKRK